MSNEQLIEKIMSDLVWYINYTHNAEVIVKNIIEKHLKSLQSIPSKEEIKLKPGEYYNDENGNLITYEDEQKEEHTETFELNGKMVSKEEFLRSGDVQPKEESYDKLET